MRPPRKKGCLSDYAACERCSEYHVATLATVDGPDGAKYVLCENCTDSTHPRRRCAVCGTIAPSERHHVASARQHPTLLLSICLNCHRLLSERQRRWPAAWQTEHHLVRCIVQGVLDVLVLWLERSPIAAQCHELFTMLGYAAFSLLPYLRHEALKELGDVGDWGQNDP